MDIDIDFNIEAELLDFIDPPEYFPPIEDDMMEQLDNHFLAECERFVKN
jgi:hypothetical protein